MKKTMCALLAALMLFSILPAAVFAETVISDVSLTVTAPEAGATPASTFTATTPIR